MKIIAVFLVWIIVLNGVCIGAQSPVSPEGWEKVRRISVNTELIVELKNGLKYKGKIGDVTPYSLYLWNRTNSIEIQADEIMEISRSRMSWGKKTLYGAGAGIVIGYLIYRDADWDDDPGEVMKAIGISVIVGTAAGAVAGFGHGLISKFRGPIYKDKKSERRRRRN